MLSMIDGVTHQLHWATGRQRLITGVSPNILGVPVRVFLDETNV